MKSKIIVHCLVQNEGRFIWYVINSVLPYVDKIMLWDMSSVDDTDKIIKTIKSDKILFKSVPPGVTPDDLTRVRQQMLAETPKGYTWLMILDGDEIWPEASIKKVTDYAGNHPDMESIAVRTNNAVGDIYHRLPKSAGNYHLAGHTGHLALRFMNLEKIKGLTISRPHGQQAFFGEDGVKVQDRDPKKIHFEDVSYLHVTHLHRSIITAGDQKVPKRVQKFKYEIGETIPNEEIPEIFFSKSIPSNVPDVTAEAPAFFWLKSLIYTIPRRIKRIITKPKVGY